ncbi:MAG: 50S ribosomal protein L13 [Firmicutes bacterium]|nr:50S ribosomal protein L13 [Bacillota bacterium]
MKTFIPKKEDIKKEWHIVDAEGIVLGRLASQVASILRGKHKPIYTPNMDCGDHVIIINADKVALTGKKLEQKEHIYHTGYVGGLKRVQYKHLMLDKPEFVVYEAVRGMLPKTKLGRKMLKKLRIYSGEQHEHIAQKPKVLKIRNKHDKE